MHHCLPKSDCGKHAALSPPTLSEAAVVRLDDALNTGWISYELARTLAVSGVSRQNRQEVIPSAPSTCEQCSRRRCVQYDDGDWTAELANHDVFGEFIASTFRNNRYVGMLAVESQDCNAVHEVIREHDTVETVDLIEQYETTA